MEALEISSSKKGPEIEHIAHRLVGSAGVGLYSRFAKFLIQN